jgi:hypothetical protein
VRWGNPLSRRKNFQWERLQNMRIYLEEKGHRFSGFPMQCQKCGILLGVLSAMQEKAPACVPPAQDHQRTER